MDGGLDAQTVWLEGSIGSRTVGVSGVIDRYVGPECIGVCLEHSFAGQFSSFKAGFPRCGAAVLACELAGLPWSAIHLAKLKLHARRGRDVDLKDDELAPRGMARMRARANRKTDVRPVSQPVSRASLSC
jgi:hypothetical protein